MRFNKHNSDPKVEVRQHVSNIYLVSMIPLQMPAKRSHILDMTVTNAYMFVHVHNTVRTSLSIGYKLHTRQTSFDTLICTDKVVIAANRIAFYARIAIIRLYTDCLPSKSLLKYQRYVIPTRKTHSKDNSLKRLLNKQHSPYNSSNCIARLDTSLLDVYTRQVAKPDKVVYTFDRIEDYHMRERYNNPQWNRIERRLDDDSIRFNEPYEHWIHVRLAKYSKYDRTIFERERLIGYEIAFDPAFCRAISRKGFKLRKDKYGRFPKTFAPYNTQLDVINDMSKLSKAKNRAVRDLKAKHKHKYVIKHKNRKIYYQRSSNMRMLKADDVVFSIKEQYEHYKSAQGATYGLVPFLSHKGTIAGDELRLIRMPEVTVESTLKKYRAPSHSQYARRFYLKGIEGFKLVDKMLMTRHHSNFKYNVELSTKMMLLIYDMMQDSLLLAKILPHTRTSLDHLADQTDYWYTVGIRDLNRKHIAHDAVTHEYSKLDLPHHSYQDELQVAYDHGYAPLLYQSVMSLANKHHDDTNISSLMYSSAIRHNRKQHYYIMKRIYLGPGLDRSDTRPQTYIKSLLTYDFNTYRLRSEWRYFWKQSQRAKINKHPKDAKRKLKTAAQTTKTQLKHRRMHIRYERKDQYRLDWIEDEEDDTWPYELYKSGYDLKTLYKYLARRFVKTLSISQAIDRRKRSKKTYNKHPRVLEAKYRAIAYCYSLVMKSGADGGDYRDPPIDNFTIRPEDEDYYDKFVHFPNSFPYMTYDDHMVMKTAKIAYFKIRMNNLWYKIALEDRHKLIFMKKVDLIMLRAAVQLDYYTTHKNRFLSYGLYSLRQLPQYEPTWLLDALQFHQSHTIIRLYEDALYYTYNYLHKKRMRKYKKRVDRSMWFVMLDTTALLDSKVVTEHLVSDSYDDMFGIGRYPQIRLRRKLHRGNDANAYKLRAKYSNYVFMNRTTKKYIDVTVS